VEVSVDPGGRELSVEGWYKWLDRQDEEGKDGRGVMTLNEQFSWRGLGVADQTGTRSRQRPLTAGMCSRWKRSLHGEGGVKRSLWREVRAEEMSVEMCSPCGCVVWVEEKSGWKRSVWKRGPC
jgi:hypothetical protein